MINPILKKLKPGDIVLTVIDFNKSLLSIPSSLIEIVKLIDIRYEPEDDVYPDLNWLHINESELLYTNIRRHKTNERFPLGNCMAIREILNDFLVEKYVKEHMLFKPSENQFSDEEYEYNLKRVQLLFK